MDPSRKNANVGFLQGGGFYKKISDQIEAFDMTVAQWSDDVVQ